MSALATSYWGYVTAGYVITLGVLGGYTAWLLQRLRRARAAQSEEQQ